MSEFLNAIPLGYYSFGTFLNFIASFVVGTILITKTFQNKANRTFGIFAYSVAIWSLFYTFSLITKDRTISLFLLRTCMIPVCFMATLFFHFIYLLTNQKKYYFFIILNYLISVVVAASVYTDYFANGYISYPIIKHWLHAGPILTFSIIHFIIMVLFSYTILIKAIYAEESRGLLRTQYIYILVGTLIGYLGGLSNYLVWYKIQFPPVFNILTSFYIIVVSIAILKYNIMDIGLAAKKLLSFTIYTVTLTTLIYLIGGIAFHAWHFFSIITIAIFVMTIPIIHTYLIQKLDPIILKDFKFRLKKLDDLSFENEFFSAVNQWAISLLNEIHTAMNLKYSAIYCINKEIGRYKLMSSINIEPSTLLEFDDPIIGLIKEKHQYLHKNDLHKNSSVKEFMTKFNFDYLFPFFAEDELIAILCIGEKETESIFHTKELEKIAYLVKAKEQSLAHTYFTENMEAAKNIAGRITEITEKEAVSEYLISSMMRLFNSKNMTIYLYDKEAQIFQCNANNGLDEKRELPKISANGYFIKILKESEQILAHQDLKKRFENFKLQDWTEVLDLFTQLDAEIILPLISSELVGFISIGAKRNNADYSRNDMLMYQYLMIVIAIKMHGLLLKEESELDPLTHAHNRRSFNLWMNRLLLLSKKEVKSLSLISLDLDWFKKINDTRGHDQGDIILQEFVKTTKRILKRNDMIFRMGGEEFIIILQGADKDGAEKFREHLLAAMGKNQALTDLTLSMGLVEFSPDKDSDLRNKNLHCIQRILLKAGDNATYRAKNEGRNKMCFAGEFKDSDINEKYIVSAMIISDTSANYDKFSKYFTTNNIKTIPASWKDSILLSDKEQADIFLFIVEDNQDFEFTKTKIKAIKARSLSSIIGVVLTDDLLKQELKELGVQRFFNFDEEDKIADWSNVSARNLS